MLELGTVPSERGLLTMRTLLRRARGRLAASEGVTLVELLLATSLGLVIIGGSIGVLVSGIRSEPRLAERSADIQAARVAMENLTREIRQGELVTSATSGQLVLVTNVNSATCGGASSTSVRSCRVTYSCSGGQCTRRETNPDGTGTAPARVVVQGLSSNPVFSYSPSAAAPTYVGITLKFPTGSGDDSITLTDGVSMRNMAAS